MQQQYAMAGPQQAAQAQQTQQAQQQAQQAQQAQQTQIQQVQPPAEQAQPGVMDTSIVTMDAPVDLMDTTNMVPQEDPAAQQQVQAEAAAMTGVGQNIDISA
jgi:type II secretory pathway pseudopilin PulG